MKVIPVFEREFYHDGRGPTLERVIWDKALTRPRGFEFFNPDDEHVPENLKYLQLINVETYAMSGEEVHGNILISSQSKAAILRVDDSPWMKQFSPTHLKKCSHYQIVFYDEIFDIICEQIKIELGTFPDHLPPTNQFWVK